MANNYVLLSSTIVQSNVSSVTFSNLPQTGYSNLKIFVSARTTRSNPSDTIFAKLNGDFNSALYDYTQMYGYGSGGLVGTGSGSTSAVFMAQLSATSTANYFPCSELEIFGYTSSEFKPCRNANGNGYDSGTNWQIDDTSFLYKSNSPITSITFAGDVGNIVAGSSFAVYGLANSNQTPASPKAIGGDIVVNDGTYWYHAFLASSTFTPLQPLSCDYLVVAGGGSGGFNWGGGGGAGGLRSTVTATGGGGSLESAISVLAQSYTITVGAGGAAVTSNVTPYSGSNSTFSTITSIGGGGASGPSANGSVGGSGGGGSRNIYTAGGAGTTGQGYAGGLADSPVQYGAGGGGGAGAAGANTNSGTGNGGSGVGGAGVAISALANPTGTGSGTYYAGGGGGGGLSSQTRQAAAGGAGGGGAGAYTNDTMGTAGTANTGGGGGGGAGGSPGGAGAAGGSGIVIVRYAV